VVLLTVLLRCDAGSRQVRAVASAVANSSGLCAVESIVAPARGAGAAAAGAVAKGAAAITVLGAADADVLPPVWARRAADVSSERVVARGAVGVP
jgi:hypothetical protein